MCYDLRILVSRTVKQETLIIENVKDFRNIKQTLEKRKPHLEGT